MKIKKLNESSLVDKKVSTLGKNGKPMYFTDKQLKDAKAKYPEYDFEETTIDKSLPQGQKAYIAKKKVEEAKQVKVFGGKAKKLNEAEEILYVIKDSHGNQLSRPNPDDDELWDRVASMEARGRRGLSVVVYTGKKESLSEGIEVATIADYITDHYETKESFEGEYSDKFRALAKEWKYNEDDLLSLINEIIRYCPEEDLKDLWIHNRYNKYLDEKLTESDDEDEDKFKRANLMSHI